MKKTAFVVACMAVAVAAQDGVVAPPTNNNVLYAVSNAQAESCREGTFKRASAVDNEYLAVCGSAQNCQSTAETREPLIEWDADVPFNYWSFDELQKKDPFPLGFRRNVISVVDGGVMCLRIPETLANHKVEVAVETAVKGTICIADTRQASMNLNANEITSACDINGQLIACFSTMQNGAINPAAQNPGVIATPNTGTHVEDGVTVSNDPAVGSAPTDYSKGFAVVIGCPGNGCWETDNEVFYRVRASKVTWDDSLTDNAAERTLDMWCMMIGSRDPNSYRSGMITQNANDLSRLNPISIPGVSQPIGVAAPPGVEAALGDDEVNQFPQLFPSDLWTDKTVPSGETDPACAAGRCADPARRPGIGEQGYVGAATTLQASYLALVLPLLALLF